jgi:hypothetical protein
MTTAKRFLIRTSLITGSTLATILGAQNLAVLDLSSNSSVDTTSADQPVATDSGSTVVIIAPYGSGDSASGTVLDALTTTIPMLPTATPTLTPTLIMPTATQLAAAPQIVIVEHDGNTNQQSVTTVVTVVVPPTATVVPPTATPYPTATLIPPTIVSPGSIFVQPQPRRTRSSR